MSELEGALHTDGPGDRPQAGAEAAQQVSWRGGGPRSPARWSEPLSPLCLYPAPPHWFPRLPQVWFQTASTSQRQQAASAPVQLQDEGWAAWLRREDSRTPAEAPTHGHCRQGLAIPCLHMSWEALEGPFPALPTLVASSGGLPGDSDCDSDNRAGHRTSRAWKRLGSVRR